MKTLVKTVIFYLGIIFFSPLLIIYFFTNQKEIILKDIARWFELLGWEKKGHKINLLRLLKEAPEFRNLYYFRVFHGNFSGKILMYLFKFIYKPLSSLYLDTSCKIGLVFSSNMVLVPL